MIRDFSWEYFTVTGDVHAYLLYREHAGLEFAAKEIQNKNTGETEESVYDG